MPDEYLVSLDLVSKSLSLSEISKVLGLPAHASSHELGSPRGQNTTWGITVWRHSSELPVTAPLESHLASTLKSFPWGALKKEPLRSARVVLNVGVFVDRLMTSVILPASALKSLNRATVEIEITVYLGSVKSPADTT
jgi:hypothetical protein